MVPTNPKSGEDDTTEERPLRGRLWEEVRAEMEAERAAFEALPFRKQLPTHIYNFLRWEVYEALRPSTIHWKTVRWFERRIRGYSWWDLQSLDFHLVRLILPRLEAFRKMERSGHPADCDEEGNLVGPIKNMEDWNAVLDKMVFAFRTLEEEENYPFALHDDPPERHELVRKVDEGMELFHKYFFALWD